MSRRFVFVANQLALDLVNTEVIDDGMRVDLLETADSLVQWLAEAGVLTGKDANRARERRAGRAAGERALARAKSFRSSLRAMAESIVDHGRVPAKAVEAINATLRETPVVVQVGKIKTGFERRLTAVDEEETNCLAPIADSAAWLLCEGDFGLIKRCGNPACILYFYDTTKNHARRWCSMDGCGNRMKAATHYRRVRSQRTHR